MKGKISFLQMMTKKLFSTSIRSKPGDVTREDSVLASEADKLTKTVSLPSCRHSTSYNVPLKPFKKRKYHSQKVKSPGFDEVQLENFNLKPKKKLTRRKSTLRNVEASGRFNDSCPDLNSDFYRNFNNGVDAVDAIDINTFQLFRDVSVTDVEFIEINFE